MAACVRRFQPCNAVRIGNLLHVDARTRLDDEYRTLFEGSLAGKVRTTEAASEKGAATAKDIGDSTNRWASELTDGAVTRVFGWPGAAEAAPNAQQEPAKHAASTEMTAQLPEPLSTCLVNLVYLNGSWEEGFTGAGELPFYAEPDRAQMVPMMTQRGAEMPYVRRPSFSCLQLPFACQSSHMALFVPSLRSGGVEQELLPAIGRWSDMRAVLDALAWSTDVTVTLPKVLLESPTMDLRKCLKTLDLNRSSFSTDVSGSAPNATAEGGVAAASEATSNAASVSSDGRGANVQSLRVEGLYHKATLDLTTRGGRSPPGFSTLLSLCSTIPANEPVRFLVDRPFVFAVLVEGLLLMVGLVRSVHSRN
ncbi:serine protease inhibitor A3F-like [Rhipicephalus sanguineus]|uniref:serine protease inhibitor A3F-like n=1 Tax=Rhipicephalus sanguineus TaxID=34632 RepID=UPI0020C3A313|nr:serine protease inhibitor A3F-like [Rhipicephalus sanguineus]